MIIKKIIINYWQHDEQVNVFLDKKKKFFNNIFYVLSLKFYFFITWHSGWRVIMDKITTGINKIFWEKCILACVDYASQASPQIFNTTRYDAFIEDNMYFIIKKKIYHGELLWYSKVYLSQK